MPVFSKCRRVHLPIWMVGGLLLAALALAGCADTGGVGAPGGGTAKGGGGKAKGAAAATKGDEPWLKALRKTEKKEAEALAQARALHAKAQLAMEEERYPEAINLWQQALGLVPVGAPKDRFGFILGLAQANLGIGHHMAMPYAAEALWMAKAYYGLDSVEHARAELTLVVGQSSFENDLEVALTGIEHAMVRLETLVGPMDDDVLGALSTLAEANSLYDKKNKALALYQDLVARHLKKHGPGHPHTLSAQLNLANLHMDMKDRRAGKALYEQVAPQVPALRGKNTIPYAGLLMLMATYEMHQQNLAQTQVYAKESLAVYLAHYPSESIIMGAGYTFLGLDEMMARHPKAAREYLTHAIAIFQENMGDDSPLYQKMSQALSQLLSQLPRESNLKDDAF